MKQHIKDFYFLTPEDVIWTDLNKTAVDKDDKNFKSLLRGLMSEYKKIQIKVAET